MTEQKSSLIQTESAYSADYAFRLWLACVDDMDRLEMGYRTYHSHMLAALTYHQKQGTQFQTAFGGAVLFEALSPDDFYGFLGKKKQAPKGPSRKITAPKLSIIDVFFKAQYPKISAYFAEGCHLEAFQSACALFFSKNNQANLFEDVAPENLLDVFLGKPAKEHDPSGMLFLPDPAPFESQDNSGHTSLDVFRFRPNLSRIGQGLFDTISFAPRPDWFLAGTVAQAQSVRHLEQIQKTEGEIPDRAVIKTEGVFFVLPMDTDNECKISCIGRDYTTSLPSVFDAVFSNNGVSARPVPQAEADPWNTEVSPSQGAINLEIIDIDKPSEPEIENIPSQWLQCNGKRYFAARNTGTDWKTLQQVAEQSYGKNLPFSDNFYKVIISLGRSQIVWGSYGI